MRFLLGVLLIFGLSCSGQKRTGSSDTGNNTMNNPIKLQVVVQESYSNIESPVFEVITGEKALKRVFAQINRTRKPGLPIPKVDFTKEVLLLYAAGSTEGAENLELYISEENQDSILMGVKRTPNISLPGYGATTPINIYSIPMTQKKIVFPGLNE